MIGIFTNHTLTESLLHNCRCTTARLPKHCFIYQLTPAPAACVWHALCTLLSLLQSLLLALRHVGAGAADAGRAEVERVRRMASRPGALPSDDANAGITQIELRFNDVGHERSSVVRIGTRSSEQAVRDAIAGSLGIAPGTPFNLVDATGAAIVVSASTLINGAIYSLRKSSAAVAAAGPTAAAVPATSAAPVSQAGADHSQNMEVNALRAQLARVTHDLELLRIAYNRASNAQQPLPAAAAAERRSGGPVLSGKPAALPRVVLASLGTGRYRGIAIAALESAAKHFGGDCEVSLHVLTDDVEGVDARYNAAHAPYREWPESGLSKFEDILNALLPVIEAADYFYFMDGDVRFNEDVHLADVAGDLVGVEHPFYPRNILGFCKPDAPPRDRGFCGYPYDRNPKSQIGIPEDHGRSFLKIEDKKRGPYWVVRSNAWYLQVRCNDF
jgi:hypothetical protein